MLGKIIRKSMYFRKKIVFTNVVSSSTPSSNHLQKLVRLYFHSFYLNVSKTKFNTQLITISPAFIHNILLRPYPFMGIMFHLYDGIKTFLMSVISDVFFIHNPHYMKGIITHHPIFIFIQLWY